MKTANFKVGERVAYSRNFLRSIGVYTGQMPFARGTIDELSVLSGSTMIAHVVWDDMRAETPNGSLPSRINVANLVRAKNIHKEPV